MTNENYYNNRKLEIERQNISLEELIKINEKKYNKKQLPRLGAKLDTNYSTNFEAYIFNQLNP